MNFSESLDRIKSGKRLARAGWNGMFVFLVPSSSFTVSRPPLLGIYPDGTVIDYHAHIDMRTASGEIVPWLASQTDLLADDWEEVPVPHGRGDDPEDITVELVGPSVDDSDAAAGK